MRETVTTSPRGVRYRPDVGFEMRCDDCRSRGKVGGSYWPLDLEHWNPRNLSRCRACEAERKRARERARYQEDREAHRARSRAYYRATRRVQLLKSAAYRSDPDVRAAKAAYLRAWRARNRDRTNEYASAYYDTAKAVYREKRREYNRRWAANKRERERAAEGRERYQRRAAA